MSEVVVARQFCGPPNSGNGGYVAGLMAQSIPGPATAVLRAIIPLDTALNLTPGEAAGWVREIAGRAKVELSGGITLETVRAYAETGADFVSAGAITHSARAVDIGFRLELL